MRARSTCHKDVRLPTRRPECANWAPNGGRPTTSAERCRLSSERAHVTRLQTRECHRGVRSACDLLETR
jgi:hypothetical protein